MDALEDLSYVAILGSSAERSLNGRGSDSRRTLVGHRDALEREPCAPHGIRWRPQSDAISSVQPDSVYFYLCSPLGLLFLPSTGHCGCGLVFAALGAL